jgi:ATP-dependent helicase/nuclease subunit A
MSAPMKDDKGRKAIRTQLDINMMVEAAAGTGKTTSLVTRVVGLISSGRCKVDSLAAITFTAKAAGQLRERVHEQLERGFYEAPEGEEKARLRSAVDDLDRAFIGTTHSFCARMLRERPVEAALDPDFEEPDEIATAILREEFWNGWYDAQTVADPDGWQRVVDAGLRPALLRQAFLRLVDYADVEIVTTPCEQPDLKLVVDEVVRFLADCQPCFPDDSIREKQDDFEKMMRELVRKRDTSDLSDRLQQLAFLEAGDHESRKPTQKNWPDKQQAKAFGERYAAIVSAHVRPILQRWREHVHCIAIEFLRPAVRQFEEERIREGKLLFSDLLIRAHDLLRDHPSVRRYFQRRFTHVLVDEFQDTDPVQAEVLFYLTGEDVEERDWRRLKPRAGSLFIVGDPKQSIYRFRRADITTYLTVRGLLEKAGGRVEQLATNFRSTRAICDFVNATFPEIFTTDDVASGRQAPHVNLGAIHKGNKTSGVYVLETPHATQGVVVAAEAETIAKWIARAVRAEVIVADGDDLRPARFSDFLLVSSVRARLAEYGRALERERVPFEITGGGAFTQSEEITNILPLLQAVVDPDETISLVAFLRGPLCGASDDALYRFVKDGGRFSLLADPPANTDETIVSGLRIARDALELSRKLPPAAALARIFSRVAIAAYGTVQEPARTRAGNALLALALARTQGTSSFADAVGALAELFDSGTPIEELDVDPVASNVVRVMNLHQAKGLEAAVVFLIDPAKPRDHKTELYVDRSGDTSRGYVSIVERKDGSFGEREIARPMNWDTLSALEKEFDRAERDRHLYVAATRAKSVLVIGVTVKNGTRGGVWAPLATPATKLFPVDEVAASIATPPASRESIEDGRKRIEARMGTASRQSYSVLPVTKLAHSGDLQKLIRTEEGLGKGTSWGRVLHRLFEAILRDDSLDVRLYATNLLKDEERDPVELQDVMNAVDAVRSSPLWQRVRKADERLMEVPFALTVPRRDVGIDEDGDTLLHGTIDLVFRESDRWFVVDYKSDSTKSRLDDLTEMNHAPLIFCTILAAACGNRAPVAPAAPVTTAAQAAQ